ERRQPRPAGAARRGRQRRRVRAEQPLQRAADRDVYAAGRSRRHLCAPSLHPAAWALPAGAGARRSRGRSAGQPRRALPGRPRSLLAYLRRQRRRAPRRADRDAGAAAAHHTARRARRL
ncbi:MAG: hypothetical protein AVDCRST_MAG26-4054, partial [uncultured Chloroflexia bacterium]